MKKKTWKERTLKSGGASPILEIEVPSVDGDEVTTTIETLMEKTGLDRSTVESARERLQELGLIKVKKRKTRPSANS